MNKDEINSEHTYKATTHTTLCVPWKRVLISWIYTYNTNELTFSRFWATTEIQALPITLEIKAWLFSPAVVVHDTHPQVPWGNGRLQWSAGRVQRQEQRKNQAATRLQWVAPWKIGREGVKALKLWWRYNRASRPVLLLTVSQLCEWRHQESKLPNVRCRHVGTSLDITVWNWDTKLSMCMWGETGKFGVTKLMLYFPPPLLSSSSWKECDRRPGGRHVRQGQPGYLHSRCKPPAVAHTKFWLNLVNVKIRWALGKYEYFSLSLSPWQV